MTTMAMLMRSTRTGVLVLSEEEGCEDYTMCVMIDGISPSSALLFGVREEMAKMWDGGQRTQ